MEIAVMPSVFYLMAFATLFAGVIRVKKSEEKQNIFVWLPISAISIMCFQVLVAGVISLVKIPVNLWTMGSFDILAGVSLLLFCIRKKEKQQYDFEWYDVALYFLMLLFVIFFTLKRYGFSLDVNYNGVDAAVHLSQAMRVIENQSVSSMYYAALHNAILIRFFGFLIPPFYYYKIFVLGDVLHLYLAGVTYWAVIRYTCKSTYLKIAGLIATCLYIAGYPLNITLFGFSYFGMGITVIAYLICVANMYRQDTYNKSLLIVLLSLGCLGVFESYMMFVPVVFFALLTFLLFEQLRTKKLISLSTIKLGLTVFLVPTILGLLYAYASFFGSSSAGNGGSTVASALNIEGGIYRDLFSNFVFLVPLAIFAIVRLARKKENSFLIWLFVFLNIFVFGLFFKVLNNQVSGYYFYKNYYLLWLLYFVFAMLSISQMDKNARELLAYGFLVFMMILSVSYFKIEKRIHYAKTGAFWNAPEHELYSADAYVDIYRFNRDFLGLPVYPKEKIELYHQLTVLTKENAVVVTGNENVEDYYWFLGITQQGAGYYLKTEESLANMKEILTEENIHYILVFKSNTEEESFMLPDYFEKYQVMFENKAGYICKYE